jgi:hypothetical protein
MGLKYLLIFGQLLFDIYTGTGQTPEAKTGCGYIPIAGGGETAIVSLGKARIVLKDGSIKKSCRLREIHATWIIYVKDGVLHDLPMDKISRLELEDGEGAVYFENGEAVIRKIRHAGL